MITTPYSCTHILHMDDKAIMFGRNMDWSKNMETQLRIYPRGMERSGKAAQGSSLQWKSKYASMVVTSYKNISTEGINEQGLAVHLLELSLSNYGERQAELPGLSASEWGQYYLDNFANVDEALEALSNASYQVEAFYLRQTQTVVGLHLAIEDASGDSAIFEYIEGKLIVHHQQGNNTLTNSPSYAMQLENLKQYLGFGGNKPLPGTEASKDRFVRASFYNNHIPQAASLDEEALAIFSILRNTAMPYQARKNDKTFKGGTLWQVVGDLTNRSYYYFSTLAFNTINISLDSFDLNEKAPALMLDIDANPQLHGEVSQYFMPIKLD